MGGGVNGVTMRKATPADAPSIAAISIEVWLSTYIKHGVTAGFANFALDTFTPAKTRAFFDDPKQAIFVSDNAEGIDGFIRVASGSPAPVKGCSDTEIATFYVQPRHHGKGVGSGLLKAALDHCRALGVADVWLATNAENDPAIAFYLAQGFTQIGETEFLIEGQGYLNNVYALTLPPAA